MRDIFRPEDGRAKEDQGYSGYHIQRGDAGCGSGRERGTCGVDPETSHSTVEMRRAIAQCNLDLFKIGNVRLEGSHALIDGKLGRYSVHLGSGVVHQAGNSMLFVVPVHSQHRGRIFLPFIDDDPKTAEIMSKILLFAEDTKIKDPGILAQIR